MISRVAVVTVLALMGLFIAAGVTFAASKLVSQPIGLSYHQRSLDDSLAPTRTITVTNTVTTVGSSTGGTSTSSTTTSGTPDATSTGASSTGSTTTSPSRTTKSGSDAAVVDSTESHPSDHESTYEDGHNDGDHDD